MRALRNILLLLCLTLSAMNSFSCAEEALSENSRIDSLLTVLQTAKEDSARVTLLNNLSMLCWRDADYNRAKNYANQALVLASGPNQSELAKRGRSNAFNNIGLCAMYLGNYSEALKDHFAALKIRQEIQYKRGIAGSYHNIGLVYYLQGNYPEALKYHFSSLKINEELGDKQGIADCYSNLGIIYDEQSNYQEALKNDLASLKLDEELGDKQGVAIAYNNIGNIYDSQGNYAEALKNYFASLKIKQELGDKRGTANSYNNIGNIYYSQANYPEALKYHNESLKIREAIRDKQGIATSYIWLGNIHIKLKKNSEAKKFLADALALSRETGSKESIKDSYSGLATLDSAEGKGTEAYEHYKLYVAYRDSIINEDNTEKTIRAQMTYDFDKKEAAAKAEQDQKDMLTAQEKEKQKTILWLVVFGLFCAILVVIILIRSYGEKKKYVKIIEEKNTALERLSLVARETNNVVLILEPDGKVVWVNESFTRLNGKTLEDLKRKKGETIYEISNNPDIRKAVEVAVSEKRSVVYESLNLNNAGKRTWESSALTPIFDNSGKLKEIIIIDTDITQRKEAEALLKQKNKDITDSISYAQRIQEAILIPESEVQKHFTDAFVFFKPKDIVSGDFYWFGESEHNKVIAVADCTGHGVPGGFMSMLGFEMLQEILLLEETKTTSEALSSLDKKITDTLNRNNRSNRDGMDMVLCAFSKSSNALQFSCSNRPLIFIRNGVLREFSPDKYSIGGDIDNISKNFHDQEIQTEKGDMIYLFSDGYADQFGGPKGKKFRLKQLKETLLSISSRPLSEQKLILEKSFQDWMGALEQVDDVLVVGIRI